MSRKVDPRANRIGITAPWYSTWFSDNKEYAKNLLEDLNIRALISKELRTASLDKVLIERSIKTLKVIIRVAKPGVVIGRGGTALEVLRKKLTKLTKSELEIQVQEVTKPELSASIAAESIAMQLERRIFVKKAMNNVADKAMEAGGLGVKVVVSGTISGPSSIGQEVSTSRGAIPTQTLRADIDFAKATAHTIGGTVGVKVWIYRGEYK